MIINVRLTCSKELVPESTVKFMDISEDFEGRDVLRFVCPNCGKEHESLRYG